MSNFTFNQSLGREVEFYNRVDGDDPVNSAFVLVVLALAGIESDAVLKDYDTLAALLAGTSNEVTNVGYARITLTQADLAPYTVDDTNNKITLFFTNQTTGAITAGDTWEKLLVCYDSDTTAGTDANIIPVTANDIRLYNQTTGVLGPLSPNGSTVTFNFATNGWCVAT